MIELDSARIALMVRRHIAGDRDASDMLAKHLFEAIRHRLMKSGVDAPLAREVAADSVGPVLERIATFDPAKCELEGWAYGFAKVKLRESKRLSRSHEPLTADMPAPEPVEPQSVLVAALDRLDPEDRKILVLRFSHGMVSPKIAERLGISAEAVRKRLSRAVERLRTDEAFREAFLN